jgi:hypothetical protein
VVRGLGVIPLAEGIETAGQAQACAEIGFDLAQGFFFGVPPPSDIGCRRTEPVRKKISTSMRRSSRGSHEGGSRRPVIGDASIQETNVSDETGRPPPEVPGRTDSDAAAGGVLSNSRYGVLRCGRGVRCQLQGPTPVPRAG